MNKPPKLITSWAKALSYRNASMMTMFYSADAVLLATYSPLERGQQNIYRYFWDFLQKEKLECEILSNVTQKLGRITIASGLYRFKFRVYGEKNYKVVDARYSFVLDDAQIINHHSSVMPK